MKEQFNVVAREAARAEVLNWADAMDLDLDTTNQDAEDAAALNKLVDRLTKAVGNGSLTFNAEDEAVYTPSNKKSKQQDPITFYERTGASILAMDGKKKNQDIKKTFAIMGDMCKVPPAVFSSLVGIDGKVCEAIFTLLMD